MSARVYRPDHTAHVRRRLAQMAVYGAFGLVVAAAAAGILAVVGSRIPAAWKALVNAAWILDAVAAGVAVLYLLVTLVAWLVYRRRRPDLDAVGAEIVGELHARIANGRRDGPA